jgi:hypothetical protein
MTALDGRSALSRDLYLTTHNTHKEQISMPSAEFEPTILASERPETDTLDRAATGIARSITYSVKIQALCFGNFWQQFVYYEIQWRFMNQCPVIPV